MSDCDIVKELNGVSYATHGTSLQLRVKRAFVRVEVIRKSSDPRFKYHLFKRLNTGGIPLTNQQLRNCTARMLDDRFLNFIHDLSQNANFKACTDNLTEEQMLGSFDEELVLRFLALKNNIDQFKHDVADFLTEYLEAVSDPVAPIHFDYEAEKAIFEKTFAIFDKSWGNGIFSRVKPKDANTLSRSFMIYHFESIAIGAQPCIQKMDPNDANQIEAFKQKVIEIKKDPKFIDLTTGGGKNSPGPLKARIGFVEGRLDGLF